MRSLFHFPFPAQPPSQQPSHCSQKYAIARILHPCAAPQRCFPPPPAPGPALTSIQPTITRSQSPWLARIAPHASLFRRMREKGPLPGNIRPKCMLFEIGMATSSPHASISGRNRAIQDTWRANLAAKGPFRVEEPEITHGAKMLPAPRGLSAAAACGPAGRALRHAAAACDTRHGRTGFAPCGAGLACLPHAPPPPPSRLCPPPPAFIAAVLHASRFAARIAPTHAAIRRAAHCGRDELSIGLFLLPSCCPRRRISLPARRTHPASRADPPRPGNKRNNTSNSMRA